MTWPWGARSMVRTLIILLAASLVLASCGFVRDSRLNPFNWFGRSSEVPVQQSAADENPLIPERSALFGGSRSSAVIDLTTPIAEITALRVERVPGGAIIRAEGRDTRQGAFNVEIVPANDDEKASDGVLVYTLERQLPQATQAVGPAQTREVVAARHLTDQQLAGVRRIRVEAAQNAREVRR